MQRAHKRAYYVRSFAERGRLTSEYIRNKIKVFGIMNTFSRRKWVCHVDKSKDNRWTSSTYFWTPYGRKRRRGRKRQDGGMIPITIHQLQGIGVRMRLTERNGEVQRRHLTHWWYFNRPNNNYNKYIQETVKVTAKYNPKNKLVGRSTAPI